MILGCQKYETRDQTVEYSVVTFDRNVNYFAMVESIQEVARDMDFEIHESLRIPKVYGLDKFFYRKHKNVKFKYHAFVCRKKEEQNMPFNCQNGTLIVGLHLSGKSSQIALGLEDDWLYDPRDIFIDKLADKLSKLGHA
ncbi:hypothetical protein KY308_03890 [Candidatus Woesearchaeota archaeon]|nr:hypothetical protein [Candidatus Woesearchaeota archaeon]